MALLTEPVLVTGGAGFLGSNLANELIARGRQIKVIDNLSSGRLTNLPHSPRHLRFVKGDVTNSRILHPICRGTRTIFHLADFIPNTARFGPGHVVKYSMNNPLDDLRICVEGTLNVLDAARRNDSDVVFTSTAAVYGKTGKHSVRETNIPKPLSAYGVSKLAAEGYCQVYCKNYGLRVAIARLFNVYGPNQRKYVMYDLLTRLANNPKALRILGSRHHRRDFIYVDDAVRGLLILSSKRETSGQIYNLGSGKATTIEQMVSSLTILTGRSPKLTYSNSSWKGDVKSLVSNIEKVKKLGFFPRTQLKDGLRQLIDWYRTEPCGARIERKSAH